MGRARAVAAGVACAGVFAVLPPAAAGGGCVHYASDRGNDGAGGTVSAPFRTIARLLSTLGPGQTGCLLPGTAFVERVRVTRGGRPHAPIRLRTAPGTRAIIRGRIVVAPQAHDVILAALNIQGDGSGSATVTVRGDRTTLIRDAVSGPGYVNRNVACIRVEGGDGVHVESSEIHDCTRATTRLLHAAGIRIVKGRGARIRDNYVFHTTGDGIALAPDAQGARVVHNIVDGNVSAVLVGGGHRTASSGNVIADNILSFSGKWNVHSFWLGRRGSGNVVTRNCLWRGFAGNLVGDGFAAYGNLVTAPRYVGRPQPLTVRRGPCFSKRPRPDELSPTDLGLPWPKLRRFLVHYTVRALPQRVQIVSLAFTGVRPASALDLRCRRGCTAAEHVGADGSGRAASSSLLGRWLRRGAVVEVRERRPGWVGSYARIRVTGLPRGVAISHACLAPLEQQQPIPCGRFP